MSLSTILSSTLQGRRNLATARLRGDVLELIHDALEARGASRTELAQILERSKAAISNTLSGDGNLRVNTIAEYLDALDMDLELRAVPRELREAEPPCVLTGATEPVFDTHTQTIRKGHLTVGEITEFWNKAPHREGHSGTCIAPAGHGFVNYTNLVTNATSGRMVNR